MHFINLKIEKIKIEKSKFVQSIKIINFVEALKCKKQSKNFILKI